MIPRFLQTIRNERLTYVLWAMSRLAFEQVTGRLHAQLLGWSSSYLGSGARVIGSRHITVGSRAHINRHAWIEAVHSFRGQQFHPTICIGRGFSASDRLHISCTNRIEIGDDCLFGSGVYISDHNHGKYSGSDQSDPAEAPVDRTLQCIGAVVIGSRVWIGDNVVIVGPLTIGDGAVVGANSVVKQDVPSNTVAAGVPLRMLKRFNPTDGKWDKNEC